MKTKITLILLLFFSHSIYAEEKLDCENPLSTTAMNICANQAVELENDSLDKYLAKAREKYSDSPEIVEALNNSQESWLVYRKSYCNAISVQWSGGTIQGVMFSSCMLKLTKRRIHNIWADYLTYMDSTPPMLPEPKL